jgi:excinuclease ABC subunit A
VQIVIRGASEHNLRQVDLELGDGLTVVTGVSGSGKTSLVFDTLYHEARRRFLEIFSLGGRARLSPARVESITGLGPAVAVGQNLLNRNPASTLATASGLHPFLRLLYARFGVRHCAHCGAPLAVLTEDEIVERVADLVLRLDEEVTLRAPLFHSVPGSHRTLLKLLEAEFGTDSLLVDGSPWDGSPLGPAKPHDLDVAVARFDRSLMDGAPVSRVRAAVQTAWALGASAVRVTAGDGLSRTLSRTHECVVCGAWFGDLEPVHFHTPCPHCVGEGCERCGGTGLHPEAAAVRWAGLRLPDLLARSVAQARALFSTSGGAAELPSTADRLRAEITRRLDALDRVGLGYISLDRPSPTLSRGESQRVRLAIALTSRLEDMLHVLDEPTIGQHPADVARLLPAFHDLLGPVVYVEHDRVAAAAADRAIDMGPGAGRDGGRVIFDGTPAGLWQADTPTGRYFSLRERVELPRSRPEPDRFLTVRGASLRNLDRIDVDIPLGRLTVITGVSGSGKSTLVEDVLAASLAGKKPVGCQGIEYPPTMERSLKAGTLRPIMVDQSPIGRNPRSNPATYTKLSDVIRDLYAAATGLSPSHFSFNRPEGACSTCKGIGAVEVRMRYLPSTWIPCADCGGQRFSDEVLAARVTFNVREKTPCGHSTSWTQYVPKALSIADFYELSIAEVGALLARSSLVVRRSAGTVGLPAGTSRSNGDARQCLSERSRRRAQRILRALLDIGLGYLPLGQPSPTLSGGEAQRVKLAKFLGKRSLSSDLLILDEPSTGLHPQDIAGLLTVLDRLVRSGATIVVVEHNTDVIRAADWVIDLGPGAGLAGGRVLYAGPPDGLLDAAGSATGQALRDETLVRPAFAADTQTDHGPRRAPLRAREASRLSIRGASAHNLRNVDVDIPKGALTVVTGVSGSGKSSLVGDVLEAEARRRFLESLSLYERQGTREGPEAPVESISGLGVSVTVEPMGRLHRRRSTVGTATEVTHHLANLLSWIGERPCLDCAQRGHTTSCDRRSPEHECAPMMRRLEGGWLCPDCGATAPIARPRHFHPTNYAAACLKCNGVGTLRKPNPAKLIVHPDKPLCAGAMYSPGFFPKGYLCKPFNGGYYVVRALAERYGFDPETTPWAEMSPEAQHAFLFGDPEPMQITYQSRGGQGTSGGQGKSGERTHTRMDVFPGFYGWVGDWDVGGTYTDTQLCPECGGAKLRPEYASVTLGRHDLHSLNTMPLSALYQVLLTVQEHDIVSPSNATVSPSNGDVRTHSNVRTHSDVRDVIAPSLHATLRRLRFLLQVGLGYVHLDRSTNSLSAGEAQRIALAGLLGSGLTSLTVLLDEPSRGLHPSEVDALLEALLELRDHGNTVIVVEHDMELIRAADHLIDMGPGAGAWGGSVVAQGTPAQVAELDTITARWLRGERRPVRRVLCGPDASVAPHRLHPVDVPNPRWMVIRGACANNLHGVDVRFPLGALVGICGVSGSGKSTLLIDTLGRALAPAKQTTSVAYEEVDPGEHDAIEGAPGRVILVDQARKGVRSPANYLGLNGPIHELYAQGEDAEALGLDAKALGQPCSACGGQGSTTIDMGFLPDVRTPCEVCRGSGYRPEAWEVRLHGIALPELFSMTIDQVHAMFVHEDKLSRPLVAARDVGLGYLVLRQPGYALSGGEAQRLKIARELCRTALQETLYILDEPTLGQHLEDVARLVGVLFRLVDAGHTVLVVEHHPHLLAACDWLVELGPGGGPDGGRVIAAGAPETVAAGDTPTAPYLREVLEGVR